MKTIQVSEETYELIKNQLKQEEKIDISSLEDLVGKKFFFRTVTYHLIGLVSKVVGNFLILENASWIADSGRFMNALKEGKLNEVEPCGTAFLNVSTLTDFFPWNHELPKDQK
jgi:hypothetical protein